MNGHRLKVKKIHQRDEKEKWYAKDNVGYGPGPTTGSGPQVKSPNVYRRRIKAGSWAYAYFSLIAANTPYLYTLLL